MFTVYQCFVTNRYRNTSSVTDMLDYLGWETHEARRTKLQLTVSYKIIHDLIAIPFPSYLKPGNTKTRAAHSFKYQQYSTSTDSFKASFSPPHHSSVEQTTVMIQSFRTDRPGQTVQTQIRLLLLLEEQSDQGLHCLLFRLHRLDSISLW